MTGLFEGYPPLDVTIKVAHAHRGGVPAAKISAYLDLPLDQVEAVIKRDDEMTRENEEFRDWIAANAEDKR